MVVDNCNGHERNSRFHIIVVVVAVLGCVVRPLPFSGCVFVSFFYFLFLFFGRSRFLLRRWTLVRDVVPFDALLLMFRRSEFLCVLLLFLVETHGTEILFLVGHKIRFRPTVGPTGITRDRRWCLHRTHHGIILLDPLLDFPRTYTKPCWRVTWSPAAMVSGGEPSFGINFARPFTIRICSSAV